MAAAVSTQLPQWNLEKPPMTIRSQRSGSDSSASSPNLCNDDLETLRLDTAAAQPIKKGSIALQDRYMSSEEDLSPAYEDSASESEYDYDDVVIHDLSKGESARRMSMSHWNKGKSCDKAVKVSYAFVGRPKVVELNLGSPVLERPMLQQRSASLANLPETAMSKLQKADQVQRHSLNVAPTLKRPISPLARSVSPLSMVEPRRPSTSYSPSSKPSTLNTDLTPTASIATAPSSRSASPAVFAAPARPSSATPGTASSRRSSVYLPAGARPELHRIQTAQTHFRHSHQIAPPTPMSPATHAFLNTDPFAKPASVVSAKPSAHKRLRSISLKLSLARIAITPSSKKNSNNTPVSPYAPLTPQTAPIEATPAFPSPNPNKLRRASTILRPKSRGGESSRGPSPDMAPPPIPVLARSSTTGPQRSSRMVARGASEREPTLVLPPFADMENHPMSVKSGKLRKRKSLMDLL